jgi:hypothetical protein
VIILDTNGLPILAENFGECHSLPHETDMAEVLSGFISALYSFAKNLTGQETREVNFGGLHLFTITRNDYVFVIAVDDDHDNENKSKLKKIAELFTERYDNRISENQLIDPAESQDFPQLLLAQEIVQDNCGAHEDCIECPNSEKSLSVAELTKTILKN